MPGAFDCEHEELVTSLSSSGQFAEEGFADSLGASSGDESESALNGDSGKVSLKMKSGTANNMSARRRRGSRPRIEFATGVGLARANRSVDQR